MNAQVTIGSSTGPDDSAVLDLNSGGTGHKGLLLPRINLASETDATTIPNPAEGLIVYATGDLTVKGDQAGLAKGVYVWDGEKWQAGSAGAEPPIETPDEVTGVGVSAPSNPMAVNATQTLTATPTPSTAVNQTPITWASSDETVASVSTAGLVTALKGGTTTITAQAPNGVTSSGVAINVKPAQPGAITYDKTSLNTGEKLTLSLQASAQPASAVSYTWTYPTAYFSGSSTGTSIELTATNPGTPAANTFGVVASNAYGDSPIRNGQAVTITRLVTSITLPATQEYTSTGTKTKLTATVAPEDASNKTVGTWNSSNTAVATVNATSGAINVLTNGTTNITCKSTDGTNITSSTCAVSVQLPEVAITAVDVTPRYLDFTATGQPQTLTATVLPTNTTMDNTITWTSSDETRATVTQAGQVTMLKAGGSIITATTSNGKSTPTYVFYNNCADGGNIRMNGNCWAPSTNRVVASAKATATCPTAYPNKLAELTYDQIIPYYVQTAETYVWEKGIASENRFWRARSTGNNAMAEAAIYVSSSVSAAVVCVK
jgi:uncharacterized protein YjdB